MIENDNAYLCKNKTDLPSKLAIFLNFYFRTYYYVHYYATFVFKILSHKSFMY